MNGSVRKDSKSASTRDWPRTSLELSCCSSRHSHLRLSKLAAALSEDTKTKLENSSNMSKPSISMTRIISMTLTQMLRAITMVEPRNNSATAVNTLHNLQWQSRDPLLHNQTRRQEKWQSKICAMVETNIEGRSTMPQQKLSYSTISTLPQLR